MRQEAEELHQKKNKRISLVMLAVYMVINADSLGHSSNWKDKIVVAVVI